MTWNSRDILAILDSCGDAYTFPMLDNGYVYLAASRLSLFRSSTDWAIVIEVFGFMPRAGLPDTWIQTYASRLHDRNTPDDYVNREAHERYLASNPHNESRNVFPIFPGDWQDPENDEFVREGATEIIVRDQRIAIPRASTFIDYGINLEMPPQIQVFELCRFLAVVAREQVLATPVERRVSIFPDMDQILQLEEWHHPDLVNDERPSHCESFSQLADVLVTDDLSRYRPTHSPNTHWQKWPEGGRL